MIEGIHYVRIARQGRPVRWYVYAWRGGPLVTKSVGPARPRLGRAEIATINDALAARTSVDPSSLLSLIRKWRSHDPARPSSPEWQALAAGTKKTWGSALDLIEDRWGDTPLLVWNDPRMVSRVVAWRDSRAATPRGADIGVTVLRALLEFGRLRGLVSFNAANAIPRLYKGGNRAEIVWTDDDCDRFHLAALSAGQRHVSDGLRLAALTGLRREDLVTLTWDHVGEFAIVKKALKASAGKRRHVTIPRIPALTSLLDELRARPRQSGVNTVLVNSHGRSWSGDGFGGSFNRIRDAAEIIYRCGDTGVTSKKHLHDVRGTFCTKLLTEAALTDVEAAGIMGWAVDRVAAIRRVYVDQSALVTALGKRLNGGR